MTVLVGSVALMLEVGCTIENAERALGHKIMGIRHKEIGTGDRIEINLSNGLCLVIHVVQGVLNKKPVPHTSLKVVQAVTLTHDKVIIKEGSHR